MNIRQMFSVSYIRNIHQQYEAHFSALAVVAGFVVDSLTLRRVDLWTENLVILILIFVAASAIVLMQLYEDGLLEKVEVRYWRPFAHADWWLPLIMQFAFGGLFSAFLVFYGRSGAILANWPFFLILLGLLVGNELFRRRYRRLYFNTLILFLAIYAYLIFAVPLTLNELGPLVFMLSGILALGVIWGFVRLLGWVTPHGIYSHLPSLWSSVTSAFVVINILYFFHFIPPIPLSLQEARVAQSVERTNTNTYQIRIEERPWYADILPGTTMHIKRGDPVYFYSSIFAPTNFREDVVHRWQYHSGGDWVTASRIPYAVVGGRAGGYRGYSLKQNLSAGRWRVRVETQSGRVLGQKEFGISFTDSSSNTRILER